MKVKVFEAHGSGLAYNRVSQPMLDSIEDQVNRWLSDNREIKIVEIKQTAAGGSWGPIQLIVSIWYEPAS
jgi:hypothetical protein